MKKKKIAVVSSIHYMDPLLLRNNAQDEPAFKRDRIHKALIEYSDPIFKKVIWQLQYEKPDIILIPGDMTKDGEKTSHHAVAGLLRQFIDDGAKIYVIPGVFDINNPEAKEYFGKDTSPVESIDVPMFTTIYAKFGYNSAISKDANSLSYVAKPFDDLWILAIDAVQYAPGLSATERKMGKIKPETMQWIKDRLAEAKSQNITVLGMMHHNIIEHFAGQEKTIPNTLVQNWETIADELMAAGLKIMFTGRNHANDITMRVTGNNTLFDIQTGSLVTPPSQYRIIKFGDDALDITTHYIKSIDARFPSNQSFANYSNNLITSILDELFAKPPYSSTPEQGELIAPRLRNAFRAHIEGDEKINHHEQKQIDALKSAGVPQATINAINSFWTDLNTADNDTRIKLENA